MEMGESIGHLIGAALAPLTAVGSYVRRGRLLHPEGVTFTGDVVALAQARPWFEVANRLAGPALLRFSAALWRHGREWPDILGCAVRLRSRPGADPSVSPDDQDLLFATARSALSLPGALFSTDPHDFVQNDYYAIGRYWTEQTGDFTFRLVPEPGSRMTGGRAQRLTDWVERGSALLHIEARRARIDPWTRLADVRVGARVELDQAALRFSPFIAGRGLEPRGMLQAMRLAPYRASQSARNAP